MDIVRARPQDAATLTEIAFAAKRHWGYPERWIQAWKNVLTISAESIAGHETYTAVVEGRMVGFYCLQQKSDGIWLEHLWVLPSAMRQGIGRALFLHAIERGKALGAHTLEIESDPNSEAFYHRMGAQRVGTKVTQLEGQPRELPRLVYRVDPSPY